MLKDALMRFFRNEEGQDLVEYALLLVFIALVVMVMLGAVGSSVNSVFSSANSALGGAS